MRAMKESGIEWIGEIPKEWHVDRLKYCADLDSEKLSEKTDPEYAFNYIDISSVTEYGGIGGTQEMTFDKSPSRARMIVHDGDTIISTVRTYLKAIAYIDGLEDHICSTGFCVVTPNEKLHPKFGYYLLQSDYFVQKIVSESVGVSYPAISSTEIGNMSIAIPDPEEQTRIAQHLDNKCAEIDALITAKEKTNALLKERRQSIIYEAVTKGLNPDAPMKDSGIEWIGVIPQNSNIARFKYLCDTFGRIGFRGYTQADIVAEGEGPISLSPSNIEEHGMNFSKCTYLTWDKYNESPEIQVGVGDIILVKTGSSYGKSAIVEALPMEATINPQFVVLRNIRCNARYLYYCMQTDYFAYQVERAVVGGTIPTMAQEKINNFVIVLPEDDLCEEIVAYLDKMCAEINRMVTYNEATIQKLKEYRQSIIYEAVTGKIEI